MLLISQPRHRDQAARLEPLQLPLNGSRAGAYQVDQFRSEKTAVGLAEEKREHTLLGAREQGIRQASLGRPRTCPDGSLGFRPTHATQPAQIPISGILI